MSALTFSLKLTFMLSGLLIWSLHFLLIYGFNALACEFLFAGMKLFGIGVVPLAIGLSGALALAALAAVAVSAARRQVPLGEGPDAAMMRMLTIGIALLSAVAVVWESIPAFVVPPCG